MADSLYLSKSAFAARIGRSPSYITWLKNNNRLVIAPDGKQIDVLATEALILETADPSKAAVAARHHQERLQRDVYSQLSTLAEPTNTAAPQPVAPGDGRAPDFQKARALREHNLAQMAEIELRKVKGELVEAAAIKLAAYSNGRLLRDQLLGLATRLAPEMSAMTDPWQIEKHLTAAIRQTLEDAERLSTADLEHTLNPS
ncbi:terminase small subunit [Pseudomonas asplenii]|uniref:terminase small subunit n=1 Tax=Pseudomonas asplenii TaxID=53407 RepID=UPI0023616C5A|nr:terminase small subunit [Pseudomonas asplenii]